MSIRVLIADDHAVVRDGLSLVLGQLDGFEVVGEAATGDEAAAVGAMRAGARGYLLKGAGHADVAAALRAVVAGQAVFGHGVADVLLAQIGTSGRTRDY